MLMPLKYYIDVMFYKQWMIYFCLATHCRDNIFMGMADHYNPVYLWVYY
jgi:hypothetical protein